LAIPIEFVIYQLIEPKAMELRSMANTSSLYGKAIFILSFLIFSCIGSLAQQKTANYVSVSGNETDRLQITVTRTNKSPKNIADALNSTGYVLTGYLEISIKQTDGQAKTRRISITGDVSTDGVPSTITIPSSVVGVPDLTLGCFFDKSLNLELVGDNRRPHPRIMYLVK
jgi:hypothetical protein